MQRLALLIVLLVSLVGCVSSEIVPSKETVAEFRCAHIVPMEPPPLGVPPRFDSVVLGFGGGSIQEVRGFSIFNTIAFLLEMPAASKRGGEVSQAFQSYEEKGTGCFFDITIR